MSFLLINMARFLWPVGDQIYKVLLSVQLNNRLPLYVDDNLIFESQTCLAASVCLSFVKRSQGY